MKMWLVILLVILCIAGILYGIRISSKLLVILSVIALLLVIAGRVYFYLNYY